MFGYITPERPELRVREDNLFRAYYCGVCHCIGKTCGQSARLTLQYDMACMAAVLDTMTVDSPRMFQARCPRHWIIKRAMIDSPAVRYAADLNVLLGYHKLRDDWQDERRLGSAAAMVALRRSYHKAAARHRQAVEVICQQLNALTSLELAQCDGLDEAAHPFAQMMAFVLSAMPDMPQRDTAILRHIGYNLGKWLYILDAWDDLPEDLKRRRYNVLAYAYGPGDQGQIYQNAAQPVGFVILQSLSEAARAYELITPKRNDGLARNILYLGCLAASEARFAREHYPLHTNFESAKEVSRG